MPLYLGSGSERHVEIVLDILVGQLQGAIMCKEAVDGWSQ